MEEQNQRVNGTIGVTSDPLAKSGVSAGEGVIKDLVDFKNDKTLKPNNSFISVIDTLDTTLNLQTGSINGGGGVFSVNPNQFSYKQLIPFYKRNLGYPSAFKFNYSASFYPVTFAPYVGTLPADGTQFDLYLMVGIFDSNEVARTGSYGAKGFIPLLNPKIASLIYSNTAFGEQWLFTQPSVTIELLNAMDYREVLSSDPNTFVFDNSDTDINDRNRITKSQLDLLLTSTTCQLGFGLCVDLSLLSGADQAYIGDRASNGVIKFPASFSFDYYAVLCDF